MANVDFTGIDALIERAKDGHRPTDDEVREAVRTSGEVPWSATIRRNVTSLLVRIQRASDQGQFAAVDDLVDDLKFELDPAAQQVTKDDLVSKIDRMTPTPSTQERQKAGVVRGAAKAQLQTLLDKAAEGHAVSDDEINSLAIDEDVTDAQLGLFKIEMRAAVEDVKARRGDLDQRDGRHERASDAEYAAGRHLSELMAENVVGAPTQDWESLPNDPSALADLIGR